jgi:F-type H+-transporting ATPase subunit alpha
MKKVAGTLKIDQAQYRELEAFSKFGSDLDTATKAVLNKGARNVELLKQPQYSPVAVEKQVAVIFAGTKGLLTEVPVEKVKNWETEYLHHLEDHYADLLEKLKQGKMDDEIAATLEKVAKEIANRHK